MNKKLFVFSIIAAVLISLVPLSVYASGNSYIVTHSDSTDYNTAYEKSAPMTFFWYASGNNGDGTYGNIYNPSSSTYSGDIYFFMYEKSGGYGLVFAIDGNIDSGLIANCAFSKGYNSGVVANIQRDSYSTYNALLNLRYKDYGYTWVGIPYCNVFSSRDEGLNALRSAIDNGTVDGGPDYGPAQFYIKPGTAAYISVSGGQIALTVNVGRNFRGEYYSNQRWSTASSLPSGTLSFNPTWGDRIVYTAYGSTNILGQAQSGTETLPLSGEFSPGYVVIYNPVYDQGGDLNPTISVYVTDFIAVAQYPLTSSVDNGIVIASGNSNEVYSADSSDVGDGGTFDYIYSYTDSDGNVITSSAITTPTGGNTVITENDDNTINGLLESILDIFRAPITHIQNLFNAGISFFGWIAQLWVWLPPAVSGIITSALVALIAIGVIKFLWK